MGYNEVYWKDRNSRAARALYHKNRMQSLFEDEIKYSVNNTILYRDNVHEHTNIKNNLDLQHIFEVVNTDSVDAMFNYRNDRVCVLNFASHKEPGGRFLEGSKAQEECLCHSSFLYNVLSNIPEHYETNKKALNKSLYTNSALFSPNIKFGHSKGTMFASVLTCAAPNFTAASKYCNVSAEDNYKVLQSRIRFIVNILYENRYKFDVVVLGAFGCGVFGQDPTDVASLFKQEINDIFCNYYDTKFVFAILSYTDNNYKAFKYELTEQ